MKNILLAIVIINCATALTNAKENDQINNMADSIIACHKIIDRSDANECAKVVKKHAVSYLTVDECVKIQKSHFALECVKSAGNYNLNWQQVEACNEIKNLYYAQDCLEAVGSKKIPSDIVISCVREIHDNYRRLLCVQDM